MTTSVGRLRGEEMPTLAGCLLALRVMGHRIAVVFQESARDAPCGSLRKK